jgi:hypothetical protein
VVSFTSNEKEGCLDTCHSFFGKLSDFSKISMVLHEKSAMALIKHTIKSTKKLYFFTDLFYIKLHTCSHKSYKTFNICSLAFSNSSFIKITSCCISTSLALEPVVLISRPNSCKIKESFLPLLISFSASIDLK